MKQKYSVGFLFDDDRVVLIKKNRPDWQQGRLNGVGGHVEEGEDFFACMEREFKEETGVDVGGWQHFLRLDFPDAEICFFTKYDPGAVAEAATVTDEVIYKIEAWDIANWNVLDNLLWIVPLAQQHNKYKPILVSAAGDIA